MFIAASSRCCMPPLQGFAAHRVRTQGLQLAPLLRPWRMHSGMLLLAKCCLVLIREEISGREAGFCWLVNQINIRMHRNLGQLMPTCDIKPV